MAIGLIRWDVPCVGYGQETFQQCWLASYRMAYAFLKKPDTTIESSLGGAGMNVEEAKKKGLLDTEFKKGAEALGLTPLVTAPFRDTTLWPGLDPGAEKFLAELQNGPLWVVRRVDGGGLHAVVAWGYDPSGDKVRYHNPYPGPDDALPKWMAANDFVAGITGATGAATRLPKPAA